MNWKNVELVYKCRTCVDVGGFSLAEREPVVHRDYREALYCIVLFCCSRILLTSLERDCTLYRVSQPELGTRTLRSYRLELE
jgi:hypothetical protein